MHLFQNSASCWCVLTVPPPRPPAPRCPGPLSGESNLCVRATLEAARVVEPRRCQRPSGLSLRGGPRALGRRGRGRPRLAGSHGACRPLQVRCRGLAAAPPEAWLLLTPSRRETPQEAVRRWQRVIRSETRAVDRQIGGAARLRWRGGRRPPPRPLSAPPLGSQPDRLGAPAAQTSRGRRRRRRRPSGRLRSGGTPGPPKSWRSSCCAPARRSPDCTPARPR